MLVIRSGRLCRGEQQDVHVCVSMCVSVMFVCVSLCVLVCVCTVCVCVCVLTGTQNCSYGYTCAKNCTQDNH